MIKTNPKKLPGKWQEGYALDYHTLSSEFIGYDGFGHPRFDTTRSEIGELLYQLKYRSDRAVIESLVEVAAGFITSWVAEIDLIVPTPPSNLGRLNQPVLEIAKGLSHSLNLILCEDCVVKIKDTPELKNVYDYDRRAQLLEGAYSVDASKVKGLSVLVFDDLYRSGATLNSITLGLYSKGEAANVYVLALTRTRSAS